MDFNELLIEKALSMLQMSKCGFRTSQHLTDAVDSILIEDFNLLAKGQDIALIAVGGYGRRELAPFSDIDIMILTRRRDTLSSETAEKTLYSYWDRGINISHSFRTINEAVEDSLKDLQTRTSIIDARFLAGSEGLWREFLTEGHQRIVKKKKRDFITEIFKEVTRRYKTYSLSLYQLEPNIKEGRGGLRDLHTILWLGRVAQGLIRMDDLKGVFTNAEYRQFKRAYEFILRSRICLHILSQRKNEVISFEYHDPISKLMGFSKTSRFLSSEIFMRIYYRHTKTVMDMLKVMINLSSKRIIDYFPSMITRKITNHFMLSRGEIILKEMAMIRAPEIMLEAFYVFALSRKPFSSALSAEIKRQCRHIPRDSQLSQTAANILIDILKSSRVYETLNEMHQLGVLDRIIPDFGKLRHLVIYEPYHRYTVDEHTLRTIKHLEALRNRINQSHQILNQIAEEVDPVPLYLALLLHDIGKGIYGSAITHEGEGYKRVKGILEQFPIEVEVRRMIEFLVKNHLLLSRYALKRDAEDPETIIWIAGVAEDERYLKALLLVTYADMAAVNPDFFSEWKARLLFDLYKRTLDHLTGTQDVQFNNDQDMMKFLAMMPERYRICNSLSDAKRDRAVFIEALMEDPVIDIRKTKEDATEVVIAAQDAPCLFLKIVSLMGSIGLNIVNARLYPCKNGLVLDKITISNWNELQWECLEEDFISRLRESITSETTILGGITEDNYKEMFIGSKGSLPSHLVNFESFVEIDNDISENHTMLEIFAPDRIGLLSDIAMILALFEIDIISAVINTEDRIANDVFYIQHKGRKVTNHRAVKLINAVNYAVSH